MANVITTQLLIDGPRNVAIKVVGILDTSDLTNTTIIDPSLLEYMTPTTPAKKIRIKRIIYDVEPVLECRLLWDATTPVFVTDLTGQGHQEFRSFGGLVNNAGAGVTGKLLLATQGWATGTILSFNLIIECVKGT